MPLITELGAILNLLLLQPVINLAIFIIQLLEGLGVPGALGFSIIIITIIVTLVTWPFRTKQIKVSKHTADKMVELRPRIEDLKVLHKDNKMAFNQAQAALFKEHGINPAAGCLPSLIPIILIFPLYQVLFAFFDGEKGLEKINYFLYSNVSHLSKLPDTHFFGLDLVVKPSDFGTAGVLLLLIPLVTGLLTFIQSKMMAPKSVRHYKTDSVKETKEKKTSEDMSEVMQSQMTFMMPLMIAFFAFQFPIGLALYWNTLTILGIIQQYKIAGWGGFSYGETIIRYFR